MEINVMEESTLQKIIKQSKLEFAEKKKKAIDEAWEIVNNSKADEGYPWTYFQNLMTNVRKAIELAYEQGLADGMEVTTFN